MSERETDRERVLRAYLRARGAVEPPPELAPAVLARIAAEPQVTRGNFFGALRVLAIGATVVAAFAVVLLVQFGLQRVGDRPSPPPAVTPPAPSLTTVSPSPTPTGAALPSAATFARVEVETWPAHAQRDPQADPVTVLTRGEIIYVFDGPVSADGDVWYHVQTPRHRTVPPFVWVRLGDAEGVDDPLVMHEPRCPEPADATAFSALAPMERLQCYGAEEITLGPVRVGAVGGPDPVDGSPGWLAESAPFEIYTTADYPNATTEGTLSGRVAPDADVSLELPGWYELRGRFDHPEAGTCERDLAHPGYDEPPAAAVIWCRQQFVINEAVPVPEP